MKHLYLGQLFVGDYDEQSTQLTRAQSLLDGLTKLSSFRFQVQVDIQTDSMITLPEGISAVGVSGPVSTSSRIHVLANIIHSSMLRVLELDSTTYQDGFLTTCAENPLVRLLESLKHLEVPILSKTSNITVCAEIASVISSKPTLYSVIGIDFGSSRFELQRHKFVILPTVVCHQWSPTHSMKPYCAGCPSTLGLVLKNTRLHGMKLLAPLFSTPKAPSIVATEWSMILLRQSGSFIIRGVRKSGITINRAIYYLWPPIQMAKSWQYYELANRKNIFVGIRFCYFADKKFAKF